MTIQLSKNEQKLNDICKTPLLPIKISSFYMKVGIVLKNVYFQLIYNVFDYLRCYMCVLINIYQLHVNYSNKECVNYTYQIITLYHLD